MFYNFSNEEFFKRNQSIYRRKILENEETKRLQLTRPEGPENLVCCLNLIGQELLTFFPESPGVSLNLLSLSDW